jgi:predicted dehydrogenase
MAERLAVGLIGCGFFSRNHLHAWRALEAEGVDLVAVCDIEADRAQRAATEFGVQAFTDATTMLSEVPLGLVDITTTMATHRPLVELAMEKRVPAIVQKPFGPTLADCVAMTEAAKAANTFLAVHENFRFQAPLLKVKELIDSGVIGEANWARIGFRTGWGIYAGQPYLRSEERFVMLDLGVHVLDVARFLLGEVDHLSAELQRRNPTVTGEDTATLLCRHQSDAVSVVECTYSAYRVPDPFPEVLVEVEGTTGAIALKPNYVIELSANGQRTLIDSEPERLSWAERPWHVVQESVLNTCRHIADALRAGMPAATSAEDNLKTFTLVEAAYEADRRAQGGTE